MIPLLHLDPLHLEPIHLEPIHLESLLAGAYVLFLITIAWLLERMARHSHRRSDRYHTGGFRFDRDRDTWECPCSQEPVPKVIPAFPGAHQFSRPPGCITDY